IVLKTISRNDQPNMASGILGNMKQAIVDVILASRLGQGPFPFGTGCGMRVIVDLTTALENVVIVAVEQIHNAKGDVGIDGHSRRCQYVSATASRTGQPVTNAGGGRVRLQVPLN